MIPITESMIPLTIIPDNTNIVIFVFFIRRGINKVSPTAKIPATNAIACTPNEFKCNKIATDAPYEGHFSNMRILPEYIHGIKVWKGAEANIVDYEGRIDLTEHTLGRLECIVASFHEQTFKAGTVEQHTNPYVQALKNPKIHILGHSGTAQYPYDHDTVIKEAACLGKAIELNEATFHVRPSSIANCRKIIAKCKKYGAFISVDSDAHFSAFVGAFTISLGVVFIANLGGKANSIKLLLAGMALSAVCSAFSSFIVYFANNKEGMQSIAFWLMGSLSGAKWDSIFIIAPIVMISILFFWTQSRILNLMLLGDEVAITLGRDLHIYRQVYLLVSSLIVGFVVYAAGMIGFVGLIIPHIIRISS